MKTLDVTKPTLPGDAFIKLGSVGFSITLPWEQYTKLMEKATLHSVNRSQYASYLIKMGLVYLQLLEEQTKK